jgi:carboxypeptidase PM20D1
MKVLFRSIIFIVSLLVLVVLFRAMLHNPSEELLPNKVDIFLDEEALSVHLSESIQFPTISNQDASKRNNEAFKDFQNWIARTYGAFHANLSLKKFNETLLYEWKGTDANLKPILVTGHYDVVPVIPGTENLWKQPPFSGRIDSGYIWGRGALDDKSGVVGILEAASYLINSGYEPRRTIYFSFGHDEEVGGINGAALVAQYLKEEGIQLTWSLDEGSFLLDGFLPGLDKPVASINVAEKGSVTLQVVGKAAGGHSSMPPKQTAVGFLAQAITQLENNRMPGDLEGLSLKMFDEASRHMTFLYKIAFANRWLFGSLIDSYLSEVPFGNAVLRTTTAPTMLSGSIKTNVLPIEAIAIVNFRLHPRDSVEDVINHVKRVVENENVEVRSMAWKGRPASIVSSWQSEGYSVISQSVKEIYGDVVVAPGLMIAGSDSRHYGKVADDAYRFNPFPLSSKEFGGFHGTNERIRVEDFRKGVEAYILIIKNGSS